MKQTLAYIAHLTKELGDQPFFLSLLEPEPDLKRAMAFAKAGAFWVFSFQDIVRLNVELATDPEIRAILQQHQREDSGHEEWFLEDLEMIFGDTPTNVRWLFSSENRDFRTVSFALASEVFRISDDRLRLVLVEAIESGAGFFFGSVARFLAVSGHIVKLKYFGGMHLDAEANHEIHDETEGYKSLVLPPELRGEAEALARRMFAAFRLLADAMMHCQKAAASTC